MLDVLNVLMKARSFIPSDNHWCTGTFTADILCAGKMYKAYCARGAIYKALGIETYNANDTYDEPYCKELVKEIPDTDEWRKWPRAISKVAVYNNDSTYEDVAAMFDKAIARLKRAEVIKDLMPSNVPVSENV